MEKDSRSRFAVHVAVVFLVFLFLSFLAGQCQRMRYGRTVSISGRDTLKAAVSFRYSMYDSRKTGFVVGFQYDLLQRYGRAQGCQMDICVNQRDSVDWWAALGDCQVDILVAELSDSVIPRKKDSLFLSIPIGDYVWVVRENETRLLDNINIWLGWYMQESEYKRLRTKFFRSYRSPDMLLADFRQMDVLSPYDDIIRKYAVKLGWDWRLLASLVYQESHFSMSTVSGREATGLMQVLPATAARYGVKNIYDPEENVRAGVMHLVRMQKMFPSPEFDSLNIVKFTLATYNCGEGRIQDCMDFAASKGCDWHDWEEVVKVIPLMKKSSGEDVSSLSLGSFNGNQTVQYVYDILNRFEEYRQIVREK